MRSMEGIKRFDAGETATKTQSVAAAQHHVIVTVSLHPQSPGFCRFTASQHIIF